MSGKGGGGPNPWYYEKFAPSLETWVNINRLNMITLKCTFWGRKNYFDPPPSYIHIILMCPPT